MRLLLLLSGCKKLTKLPPKLFINNPDLLVLNTDDTLIVTPPENIRRQGCGPSDFDNFGAIKRYLHAELRRQLAQAEVTPTL